MKRERIHTTLRRKTETFLLNFFIASIMFVTTHAFGDDLIVELESLTGQNTFAPFSVQSDSAASSGQYIEWSNNGSNQLFSPASDSGSDG